MRGLAKAAREEPGAACACVCVYGGGAGGGERRKGEGEEEEERRGEERATTKGVVMVRGKEGVREASV